MNLCYNHWKALRWTTAHIYCRRVKRDREMQKRRQRPPCLWSWASGERNGLNPKSGYKPTLGMNGAQEEKLWNRNKTTGWPTNSQCALLTIRHWKTFAKMEKFAKTQCLLSFGTNRVLTRFPCIIISLFLVALFLDVGECSKLRQKKSNREWDRIFASAKSECVCVCVSVKGSVSRWNEWNAHFCYDLVTVLLKKELSQTKSKKIGGEKNKVKYWCFAFV